MSNNECIEYDSGKYRRNLKLKGPRGTNWYKYHDGMSPSDDGKGFGKMTKLRIQVQHLQPGDIINDEYKVIKQYISYKTPRGKVNVDLENNGKYRSYYYGKYTMINVERME